MKRRQHHEEHENLERWLVSYADFITLLFAFFVVMYAISTVDVKKFERMSSGMKSAFLEGAVGDSPIVVDFGRSDGGGGASQASNDWMTGGRSIHRSAGDELVKLQKQLETAVERRAGADTKRKLMSTEQTPRGLVISLVSSALFAAGEAELSAQALPALEALGAVLARSDAPLRVEGHTDDLPISTPRFPSNWELSTQRATNVLRFLVDRSGLDPGRLSAAGYAEFRPVAPNEDEEGRARNRRIEIVVISGSERAQEPAARNAREGLLDLLEQLPSKPAEPAPAARAAAAQAPPAAGSDAPGTPSAPAALAPAEP